ncbi:MAG: fumarate hydratase, partial [Fidelibacterota bacterium]
MKKLVDDRELLKKAVVELIKRASTDLPEDVVNAIRGAAEREDEGSQARNVLMKLLENAEVARSEFIPICQDTGTNIYYIYYPPGVSQLYLRDVVIEATREATARAYLRPNAVHSITGKNSGDNVGIGSPFIHFNEWNDEALQFKLMLKGGGCENVGAQYKLPDSGLKAGRDLDGVKHCVVDTVTNAQGLGCAPGIIGVGIGGDRGSSYLLSKEQFFRKLDDRNEDETLADMEDELFEKLNSLGIGPMGFGGKTTVLGVKIGHLHRLPASYFVSVSYMCWAYRRKIMTIKNGSV